MSNLVAWAASPPGSATLALAGIFMGIIALVPTLIGLWLTYNQSRKAADAAVAAQRSAADTKSRVAAFDAIVELSSAASALSETERHLRANNWYNVSTSYSVVNQSLLRFRALDQNINSGDKAALQAMSSDIGAFIHEVDKTMLKGKAAPDPTLALKKVREYADLLIRVDAQLKKALT